MFTFGIFSFILLVQFIFQTLFLGDYYINKKNNDIEHNIYDFAESFTESNWNLSQLNEQISLFVEYNNAPLVIMDEDGITDTQHNYSIVMQTEEGLFYKIFSGDIYALDTYEDFEKLMGSKIHVEGILMKEDESVIEPFLLQSDEVNYYNEDLEKEWKEDQFSTVNVTGKVVYFNELVYEEALIYKNDLLLDEVGYWFYENREELLDLEMGEVIHYSFEDELSGIENIVFIYPIEVQSNMKYIFVMHSLQPINEAISIMNQFTIFVLGIGLVLIVLSSFLYSRTMTKPIVEMNRIAERMANLDFSTSSTIQSDDELGNLSRSLNTLSNNLDQSLKELQASNAKLKDEMELEREQEKRRKEFVANVSHELKTPLGIIKGYAEGIKDGIYEEKKEHYLTVILEEIDSMNALVLDMLELSKLEEDSFQLTISTFPLQHLFRKIKTIFSHMLEEKQIAFEMTPVQVHVEGDMKQLEQVLRNLVHNAIRYSKHGERVFVRAEVQNTYVTVSVVNTGAYIEEEELTKIWDRFYRIEKSRNRTSGGTGLGLLIVKTILERHRNEYGVSNSEEGVVFHFTLPRS